mgnify:CR=1 FL=1
MLNKNLINKSMTSIKRDPKIVVALDFDQINKAETFIDKLDPKLCRLKVGKEMFTHFGPSFVTSLVDKNYDVFLDLIEWDMTFPLVCSFTDHRNIG